MHIFIESDADVAAETLANGKREFGWVQTTDRTQADLYITKSCMVAGGCTLRSGRMPPYNR